MNKRSLSLLFPLFVLSHSFDDLHTRNKTLMQEFRQPRVTGRIVKVYSGTRPQPIVCPGEGFQPDPADCSVFYRCVISTHGKYTSFRFQCSPGTIYDPDSEVCNFPQSTRRSECGGILSKFVPRHFKNELDNVKYEMPSPIRNVPYFEGTTKKNKVSTINPILLTSKRQAIQTTLSTPLQWMLTNLYQTPKYSANLQNGDPCITEGFLGDSEDCRKFYRCVGNSRGGFIRYEFICSDNTIWDEDAKSCNHAWAVERQRCGRGKSPDRTVPNSNAQSLDGDDTSDQTIQQQLQVNYGSKVSQSQTQISNGSNVLQNQTQINYENGEDNKRESAITQNQIQISHGSAVSQTQTQIKHNNKGTQTQLLIDHTNEASQSQTQIQYESEQSTVSSSVSPSYNNTANECTQNGFMGDKKDCKKFYRCVDNGKGSYTKYEFTCGEGTVWDSNIEGCNHAWAVRDCGRKSPSSSHSQNNQSMSTTVSTTSTKKDYTTFRPATDDEEEIDNSYGNQNPMFENDTLKPNSTTSTSENNPITEAVVSESNECSSTGFVGDKNDCKKFYRCVDNGRSSYTKYEFKCGEGTVWDPKIEACNHAWAVNKCGGSYTTDNTHQIGMTTNINTAMTTVTLVQTTTEESQQNNDDEVGYGQQQNVILSTTTSTTKHPDSGQTKKCKSSGFIGDKDDCKKFYRCVNNGNGEFTRYEFSCGEGTVWDPKIEACNHPWAVEHCGEDKTDINKETTTATIIEGNTSSSSTETQITVTSTKEPSTTSVKPAFETQCKKEGFVGDNNDCKKFYRCVDNGQRGFIKYEFTCGEGTVWDPEISTCNYPTPNHTCSGIESELITTGIEKEDDEMYTETTTLKSTTSTGVPVNTASTSSKPQSVYKVCKSEGFYGDTDDCRKFYRCVNNGNGGYTKYEFNCGEGTVWDQEIQGCNHASDNNNCPPSDSSPLQPITEITFSTSTTESQQEHSTTKREPDSEDRCTSEGFYSNSKDCKKFYRCVDNGNGGFTKYDFICGDGTLWIQDLQTCDHDNGFSNCSEVNISGSQGGNIQDTTATSSTTPPKENDEYPSELSNDSPTSQEKCSAEGFYPNKNDCTRFYRCVDNGNGEYTKYDFTCGEGTAWDSNLQTCNHKNEVQSCQESSYVKPAEYDEETNESSTTKTSTTGSTTERPKPENMENCNQEGYYGNKDDCQKFYRCVDNGNGGFTQYDFICGEGTIWDPDITTCNHPQDVKNPSCEQSGSPSTSSSETSSITSTTESSGTTQNNKNCSQEEFSKKPNKDVNCTKEGFYADSNDCKKFYRCVDWDGEGQKFSVFHFECGEGTIWDPALDTCNHEDSVYPPRDCSGSQSQSENSSQEPTEHTSSNQEEATTSQDYSTTTTQATTEELTTTQQSSTQKQTTTEKATTQLPTSTTNQQPTTQQSTTSEQTTVQQPTTSKQTTTQQTTSSEQSTTQESTTNEQTTTQQSPTSEKTTTQQTTSSQQTTTQESPTSEQTTTQQSTSSDQITTQQSTTSEQSTVKQTTEQVTTQQSTLASEDVTTQQSTTSEENTTQMSTTEQTMTDSTMDSSTANQQTTGQSNETTEQTTLATEQQTDSSTTEQESTTENETTESSLQDKECPETDDDQNLFVCPTSFRRHPKYCNLFYQCEEDDDSHEVKIAVFKCPNETIYDETQTKCVKKDKADKKCNGEMAKKRRIKRFHTTYKEPVTVSRENLSCPAIGNFPLEKEECSPVFLKCQTSKSGKLSGLIYQCPEGFLYWSISKRCEQQSNIIFCKTSKTSLYPRWEIPVERKNVAK